MASARTCFLLRGDKPFLGPLVEPEVVFPPKTSGGRLRTRHEGGVGEEHDRANPHTGLVTDLARCMGIKMSRISWTMGK